MSIDLREVMQQRSTVEPTTAGVVRLGQVHRRIVRIRRRRRLATAAGLAVAMLAGATLASLTLGDATRSPNRPAPPGWATGPTIDGFAEYAEGGRVVATEVAHLPEPSLTLTLVPTTLELLVGFRCDPLLAVEVRVEGHMILGGSCGSTPSVHRFGNAPTMFGDYGLAIGQPVTFTLTVVGGEIGEAGALPIPISGEFALAIAEGMAVDQYPLPPRPEVLAPLMLENWDRPVLARLDSNRGNPRRAVSQTIKYRNGMEGQIASQTPGFLHVTVDGVAVTTFQCWDYAASSMTFWFQLPKVDDGASVTIRVEPEHVTGEWALIVME